MEGLQRQRNSLRELSLTSKWLSREYLVQMLHIVDGLQLRKLRLDVGVWDPCNGPLTFNFRNLKCLEELEIVNMEFVTLSRESQRDLVLANKNSLLKVILTKPTSPETLPDLVPSVLPQCTRLQQLQTYPFQVHSPFVWHYNVGSLVCAKIKINVFNHFFVKANRPRNCSCQSYDIHESFLPYKKFALIYCVPARFVNVNLRTFEDKHS